MIADLLKILNFYSQAINGKPLVYIKDKGFFLLETATDDNGQVKFIYEGLDGTTTLFDLPDGTKVYRLDSHQSVAQLVREIGATSALHGRSVFAAQAQGWRFTVADFQLSQQQQRLAEKYNIEDLAQQYENPFLRQILTELRVLTVQAIEKAVRNKKSKREILLTWEQIRQQAAQNNIVELEDLRDKLLRLSGKQKRGENASLIREAKKELRQEIQQKVLRTLKIWTVVVLFFSSLALGVSFRLNRHYSVASLSSDTTATTAPALTQARINQAINHYNATHTDKIYSWRQSKITLYLLRHYSAMTDDQLRQAIDTLATTAYPFWRNLH